MRKIEKHPVLEITESQKVTFLYEGREVSGNKGFTIAAALHQAGYPVHSHSLKNRNRSLECGIGKCGACEMLVDGQIRRICITKIDAVKEVKEIPRNFTPEILPDINYKKEKPVNVYRTTVAIIGAGPAGLACREELNKNNIENLVIDINDRIGGQFVMQTHQFFFFEKEKKFGGMRGFDIAKHLAGEETSGIFLNCTVWDIFDGNRLAIKNIKDEEVFYVDAEFLVVAAGAVPFMPSFKNDDLPGVYTAAVVQKMMNNEFTLLGKNILTVGAGNIGYLTSYQLMQAGANVKAILEAQPYEGGFPVQANRVRRLGVPILTSHILLEAIPNEDKTGICGAIVAECSNFKAIARTEKVIDGIDAINICTGLVPDDSLLLKGKEVFGRNCFGAGDAIRIGEGTSAVVRGKQVAFEILEEIDEKYDYNEYLITSKEYIDSQQHPVRVLEVPALPSEKRMMQKPFVQIDCLYGFACNPCVFACKHGAIQKDSTSSVPVVDYDKCIGCMDCVYQCPGLAILGYNLKKERIFFPCEFEVTEKAEVYLVDNQGIIQGEGVIDKIFYKENKTNIVRVLCPTLDNEVLLNCKGFILKEKLQKTIEFKPLEKEYEEKTYICHCEDVQLDEILEVIGDRKFISVDEIKHTTRLGMGACRGKRCIQRLKQNLRSEEIMIVGVATPRGPLANQVEMGELYPHNKPENIITNINRKPTKIIQADSFIAGGGIAGSSLFRYLAEAGMKPVLANYGHGSSWRNIAGGRPVFSVPEISDVARHNLDIFKELHASHNIDFRLINYVSFAHNEESYNALEASRAWQDARMVDVKDFRKEISPYFNSNLKTYKAALITKDCWQANPGKVIDSIRKIGIHKGGKVVEDTQIIDLVKEGKEYRILVQDHNKEYMEYRTPVFINALGQDGDVFAKKLGMDCGLYPVKHQAFITRRLPMLGVNGNALDMVIDRRHYKGFSAVYGQQLAETGQIIGCASPAVEPTETWKNLKINSKEFLEIVSEVFIDWIPELSSVGFQAVWAGYYIEPRWIIDPDLGLFLGLRGQGFMLSQYLAKIYVDKLMGKPVPEYFHRFSLKGDGLLEKAFK